MSPAGPAPLVAGRGGGGRTGVPGGTVLVGSSDWRLCAAQDAPLLARQRRDGRSPGQVRLRLHYGSVRSRWFDWVWVDRDAMVNAAQLASLHVTAVRSRRQHYVVRLVRPARLAVAARFRSSLGLG